MPQYVYLCQNKHVEEITHSIKIDPVVFCGDCAEPMHRVPMGGAGWMNAPFDILADWSEVNLKRWREKKPRFSPDQVNSPDGRPGGKINVIEKRKFNVS